MPGLIKAGSRRADWKNASLTVLRVQAWTCSRQLSGVGCIADPTLTRQLYRGLSPGEMLLKSIFPLVIPFLALTKEVAAGMAAGLAALLAGLLASAPAMMWETDYAFVRTHIQKELCISSCPEGPCERFICLTSAALTQGNAMRQCQFVGQAKTQTSTPPSSGLPHLSVFVPDCMCASVSHGFISAFRTFGLWFIWFSGSHLQKLRV